MAPERTAERSRGPVTTEVAQETQLAGAWEPSGADPAAATLEGHARVARRHLEAGAPTRAFAELVQAARSIPMTGRLAAYLVRVAPRAGAEAAAVTLIQSGLEDADATESPRIRRQLARLFRRAGELQRAREHLEHLLSSGDAREPDRGARAVLNALLARDERWDELDASLEKQTRDALRQGRLRRAARAALGRARLSERQGNPGRAVRRYEQAAHYLEQAEAMAGAFDLRVLWLRALRDLGASGKQWEEALAQVRRVAAAAGLESRAKVLLAAFNASEAPRARADTQRELLKAGEAAEAEGRADEAGALFQAAATEAPDPNAWRRLEAHHIAHRAWRELSMFYRARIERATSDEERVELLSRLAELLEDELQDRDGAARAYEQIFGITGDEAALREQLRLLAARKDPAGVQKALDHAVDGANTRDGRVQALVARGEASLRRRQLAAAEQDFAAAVDADPRNLRARAGHAEAAAALGRSEPFVAFRDALRAAPRRFPGRAALLRRLARVAAGSVDDTEAEKWALEALLEEAPADLDVADRLARLARRTADEGTLEHVLSARLEVEPRGDRAREARLELVELMDRSGRTDESLQALRNAVRFEPGHRDAWLLLAERCAAVGSNTEAAWALEQAASCTADDLERAETWQRLAAFVRDVLKDFERAATFERRARRIQEERGTSIPEVTMPPPSAVPPDDDELPTHSGGTDPLVPTVPAPQSPSTQRELEDGASSSRAVTDPEHPVATVPLLGDEPEDSIGAYAKALRPEEEEDFGVDVEAEADADGDPEYAGAIDSRDAGGVDARVSPLDWASADAAPEAPAASFSEAREPSSARARGLDALLGEAQVLPTPSAPTPMLQRLRSDRVQLLSRVRESPLDPTGYRALSTFFAKVGDPDRQAMMTEIAAALEGDGDVTPRVPRLILSTLDRAGLRHPSLRSEEGELLALCGGALARVWPDRGPNATTHEEFGMDAGRGARVAAESLFSAVRILGLRAPDVFLSEDNGPPFWLVSAQDGPRLMVGRLAVRRVLPEAELRFFAGRALYTQSPDLLAVRTLKRDMLAHALTVLAEAVEGDRPASSGARTLRAALPPKSVPRIRELLPKVARTLSWSRLIDGARHSSNRAGLVVCGAVAPALAALQGKKALEAEVVELIRFAASERYLELRRRRLT